MFLEPFGEVILQRAGFGRSEGRFTGAALESIFFTNSDHIVPLLKMPLYSRGYKNSRESDTKTLIFIFFIPLLGRFIPIAARKIFKLIDTSEGKIFIGNGLLAEI